MGAPNDVVGLDRFVRVITGTMAAYRYNNNWPTHCLAMLERAGRELKPLLKPFGRPLGKKLGVEMDPHISGIVLIKEWSYRSPDKPPYVVCFGVVGGGVAGGWILVRKPDNQFFLDQPLLLADAIGKGVGGSGGMQMFIDAW